MLKLTPPEFCMRALAHYIIERQTISRFCLYNAKSDLAWQNPGEHFSLYEICAVVLVLRFTSKFDTPVLRCNIEKVVVVECI